MARPDRTRRRTWRFKLDDSTILEVSAPQGATEKQVRRRGRLALIAAALLTASMLVGVAGGAVWTNEPGYAPGSTVYINGDGMADGEEVQVDVFFPDGSLTQSHVVTADEDGNFADEYVLPGSDAPVEGTYSVVAIGMASGNRFETTFDDATLFFRLATADTDAPSAWSVNWERFGGTGPTSDTTCANSATSTGTAAYSGNTLQSGSEPVLNANSSARPTSAAAAGYVFDYWSATATSTTPLSGGALCKGGAVNATLYGHFDAVVTNQPPTVAAGGPYSGAEGSNIAINGASATDPDSDPLTYSWAKNESGIVDGGSCTLTNSTTLSPTLNCNDNGSVTLTLTVDDGNGHTPSAQATVNVSNADPSATPSMPTSDVNEGDSFDLALSSPTDPGSNDTFTYQFDCGDGSGYNAASTTASRSCPTTDNGSRSVSLKILDDDGGFTEYPGTVTVVNVNPTVAAPLFQVTSIGCRTSVTLSRIGFNDPGADADWTVEIDWDDGSTTSYDTASKGVQPVQTHQYDTPGTYTATVTVTDKDGGVGSNTSSNSVVVNQTYTVDFLPPFDDSTPSGLIVNKMKNGRVVPVKATIYDDCALSFVTDPNADVTIKTSKTSGTGTGDPIEVYADAGQSSAGTNEFRFADGFWIYNLDSKALGLVVNNLYRVDIYVGPVKATVANWAVLQPVK